MNLPVEWNGRSVQYGGGGFNGTLITGLASTLDDYWKQQDWYNANVPRDFGSLQISAAGGRTFVQQVYVQFDNGQEQIVRALNRTLTGNQSLTLDLDGNQLCFGMESKQQ